MNVHTPKDIVTIDRATAFATFTSDDPAAAFAPILAELRAIVDTWRSPGTATAAARDEIKSFAFKITKSRTAVEAIGKELAAEAKSIPKRIDASRRYIEGEIEAIREAVRAPLTEWERVEAARVAHHKNTLDVIAATAQAVSPMCAPEVLRASLAKLEAIDPATGEEFSTEIEIAKAAAIKSTTVALAAREKADAESSELEALRKEKAERERLDREADIAAEAARAAVQHERDAAAARERRLIEEKEAAERAAVAAAANAKAELEAHKAAEAEAQRRREANKRHRGNVNREALAAFVENEIDETTAKKVIGLIALGRIPAISITY